MSQITDKSQQRPNRLVPLKLLVFLFFGALQCIYAYLPYHMEYLGFTRSDIRQVTLIAALVSIIGPLLVSFILDRISVKRPAAYGKWLRVLLFVCFLAAGIFFALLLAVIPETREPQDAGPKATFSCDDRGGHLFVKRIDNGTCENFNGENGHLKLYNCTYTCELPENFKYLYNQTVVPSHKDHLFEKYQALNSSVETDDDYDINKNPEEDPEALRQAIPTEPPIISPPHICVNNGTVQNCHVYLDGVTISLKTVEGAAMSDDDINKFSENWCKHPLTNFSCNVPTRQIEWMKTIRLKDNASHCTPAVECLIRDPHEVGSILEKQTAVEVHGVPYRSYFTIRIIAEIFPIIIHMLLNIAIIIATRENTVQRGDVGHQLAFYPIGVLVFASILGVINHVIPLDVEPYFVPIIVFAITMLICAVIVVFSGKLPLTPNDWWWHTKYGMLAIPMSALKRYKWVIASIALTAFILGGLWHVQEAYRHIFLIDLIERSIIEEGIWRSKTFVYVIGALLAIPFIWNGEKIADCIGHTNIFILAFVSFALRFAGLYYDYEWGNSWVTLFEILEPISFYLPWLAILLFIRHLVPKKFMALSHAIFVILFFAIGRALGFFYGVSVAHEPKQVASLKISPEELQVFQNREVVDLKNIHTIAASIACGAAVIYFIVYHLILLPRYRVPTNRLAANNESKDSPQRVFHDERSRKGYFRY